MERGVASEGSDLGGLGIAPREFEVDHMDSAPHLKKKKKHSTNSLSFLNLSFPVPLCIFFVFTRATREYTN